MNTYRQKLIAAESATNTPASSAWGRNNSTYKPSPYLRKPRKLMLSSFDNGYMLPGLIWRGFSDRIMGGASQANLGSTNIRGKNCIQLTGSVTRKNNGGFIQMALYFGPHDEELNGSDYKGIELLVNGNNENYNVHIRTSDCGWHDESYRTTLFAKDSWHRIQIPWEAFEANGVNEPLNSSKIERIAILGWMREFEADIALAEIALYD